VVWSIALVVIAGNGQVGREYSDGTALCNFIRNFQSINYSEVNRLLAVNFEAESMLQRAWRTSIIGFVLFPVVTNIYSMYLLIRASTLCTQFSPAGQKLFCKTLAVNLLA